jgi:hypothetical protein
MTYTPSEIETIDYVIARNHMVGGEVKVFATRESALLLGSAQGDGSGSGTVTIDEVHDDLLASDPSPIAMRVDGGVVADAAVVVTLEATFNDNSVGTVAFTFDVPGWVSNKTFDFGHNAAVEGVPSSAGKTIKAIGDVVSITNAQRYATFEIWKLPQDETKWKHIPSITGVNPKSGVRPGVPIEDALDGTKEVVEGRSPASSIELRAIHKAYVDGFARFAGGYCCLRVERWAGGKILLERSVMVNCILEANPEFGEGSDKVQSPASGFMTRQLNFAAP